MPIFGIIFSLFTTLSTICAIATGRIDELCFSVVAGANNAVNLSIALLGSMCLWNGIACVFDAVGVTKHISRFMTPIVRLVFREVSNDTRATDAICASFSANLLGLGTAGIPLGIKAMQALARSDSNKRATNDMVTFAVLNTTPIQLIPSTIIAMRSAHGSEYPFEILVPVWICSVATSVFAVVICRLLARVMR